MIANDHVQILLEIKGKLDGLTKARKEVSGFQGQLGNLKKALLGGLGLGGGFSAWSMAERAISSMVNSLKQAVSNGIRFNAEIQTAQMGLAAVLRTSSPQTFQTFNAAATTSAQIIRMLSREADNASISYSELIRLFTQLSPLLTGQGVPFAKQIKLVGNLGRASSFLQISPEKVRAELQQMMRGKAPGEALLPAALNLSPAQLDAAAKAGTTVDLLNEKLADFASSATAAEMTWDRLLGQIQKTMTELQGAAIAGAFTEASKDLKRLVDVLTSPDMSEAVANLSALSRLGYTFSKWGITTGLPRTANLLFTRGQPLWGVGGASMTAAKSLDLLMHGPTKKTEETPLPDIVTGTSSAAGQSPSLEGTLARARNAIKFDYSQRLIDLQAYLDGRRALIRLSLEHGFIDQEKAADELQEILHEQIKSSLSKPARPSSSFAESIFGGLFSPEGSSSRGLFTTAAGGRYWQDGNRINQQILDLVRDIRDAVRNGIPIEAEL